MILFMASLVYSWDYGLAGSDWTGLCYSGGLQSPVDLNSYIAHNISAASTEYWFVKLNYEPVTVVNSNSTKAREFNYLIGKNFQVFADFGNISANSTDYSSRYIKFHSPAEHTINQVVYPLELQIVHTSGKGLFIISVLYQYSNYSNPLLDEIIHAYQSTFGASITLQNAIAGWFAVKNFWYYEGSLTEPPCTEGVKYVIYDPVLPATIDQIFFFRSILVSNAREMMPQNSRQLSRFTGLQDKVGFSLVLSFITIIYFI